MSTPWYGFMPTRPFWISHHHAAHHGGILWILAPVTHTIAFFFWVTVLGFALHHPNETQAIIIGTPIGIFLLVRSHRRRKAAQRKQAQRESMLRARGQRHLRFRAPPVGYYGDPDDWPENLR